MSATSVTLRGRTAAEARMVDACTIVRLGSETFNPTIGEYTTAAPTSLYVGACEVQVSDGLNAQEQETGGQVVTQRRVTVKVPMSVTGVQVDDVVTITAAALDADLVGQAFRVVGEFAKSFATARRLQVEGTTAP